MAATSSCEIHPVAVSDVGPEGPARAVEYPHTAQHPSTHDHGGQLSLAGGSASSGDGEAEPLDVSLQEDVQDESAERSPPS